MNVVTEGTGGRLVCSCGAIGEKAERARFQRRHPALCSARQVKAEERKAFNKQLAQGVRSVADDAVPASDAASAEIEEMFEAVENSDVQLTSWEEEFMKSIRRQWSLTSSLSAKQKSVLSEVFHKVVK
jgi:enterochelin esterase-like enzyme